MYPKRLASCERRCARLMSRQLTSVQLGGVALAEQEAAAQIDARRRAEEEYHTRAAAAAREEALRASYGRPASSQASIDELFAR